MTIVFRANLYKNWIDLHQTKEYTQRDQFNVYICGYEYDQSRPNVSINCLL